MLKNHLIRFMFVGLLNTLFGYSLYALFIYLGLIYYLAIIFSTALGALFNFKTIGKLVFNSNDNSLFFLFIFYYLALSLLNIYLVNFFTKFINDYYVSGFISVVICALASFIINRKLMYKPKEIHL
jgi:putative flippase GtrA